MIFNEQRKALFINRRSAPRRSLSAALAFRSTLTQKLLQEGLKHHPHYVTAWTQLSTYAQDKGDFDMALLFIRLGILSAIKHNKTLIDVKEIKWSSTKLRPFLKVLHSEAVLLKAMGHLKAAVECAKTLLILNDDDNQGLRYLAVTWAILAEEYETAEWVLKEHDYCTGTILWDKVLLSYVASERKRSDEA